MNGSVTCLNGIYKLLIFVLAAKIEHYVNSNKMLVPEKLTCKKYTKESKELLILDSFIAS